MERDGTRSSICVSKNVPLVTYLHQLADSIVLHPKRVDEILKWTKEHLDAYLLASADVVIIEQRDEPG
jgi:hypothetical protein